MKLDLFTLTFVVLLVLQLTGSICISWWLVFLPIAIPLTISILLLAFAGLIVGYALNQDNNARSK